MAGVIRAMTSAEVTAYGETGPAFWVTTYLDGTDDPVRVLASSVLAIFPFKWRQSSDLSAAIGFPNPNLP
jgi:hypothetical protein